MGVGLRVREFAGIVLLGLVAAAMHAQTTIIRIGGHVLNGAGKPIPRAKVTASGIEAAPAVSDSSGLYVIDLKTAVGQSVNFHVEQANYSPFDATRAIALAIPEDFALKSNKTVSSGQALVSLRTGLEVITPSYRELNCAQPPCATSYAPFPVGTRLQAAPDGSANSIEFVSQSNDPNAPQSIFGTISLQDMTRLTDEQKVLIVVYEQSIGADYAVWSSLSSQLQNHTLSNADRNAIASRLVPAGRDMCGDFDNLIGVLQDINIQVWDHYWSIKGVCDSFRHSHLSGSPAP
jgi:hypothetical protein